MTPRKSISRRRFLDTTAKASLAFSIVPRQVLGGPGFVAPSDQLTLAYIGCGTQGMREMTALINNPALRIVAVCDPNKMSTNYVDWSPDEIRDLIRKGIKDPNWGSDLKGIPGGRDIGQEFVNKYYARSSGGAGYKGCASYADFRELLEKERDVDAVKIMTPDHHHATIAIAAMKKGKHVVIHKPIANRMYEARMSIETARTTGVSTHLLAYSKINGNDVVKKMIHEGAIGTLREIHNWSNRPVWPQWTTNPVETVPIPDGFDWNLWLGPVPDRPYHPNYTNCVFRGWYDFGGGSIADMGHYSLWPLFLTLGIRTAPLSAEACGTTTCAIINQVSDEVINNVAFPYSCMIRFKFPQQEELPPFELFWYDGGMRPRIPDELEADGKTLEREGMMFVGDKGKILADFRCETPRLLPESSMREYLNGSQLPKEKVERNDNTWIDAFRNKTQSPGSFLLAGPISETILLGAVALRAGKKVEYDSASMKITNNKDANQFLVREYRKGWEL
ncbi:MAG TPA: Gfo/Idh/MocA family oxidoreductase [Puia sp.]|nr:Gfo/Idh/MocA family oxidoreductase [Puia sp.]